MSLGFMQRLIDGSAPSGSPETRFGGQLTASRVFDGRFYEEQLLDQYIQTVPGATLTHGIAAICGEALRLYLEAHNELGKESLSALLEVNVRNAGAHALAGNRIAVKQMQLNTAIAHPIDRLRAIVSTNPEIDSIDDTELTSFKLRSLSENLPAPLLALLGKRSNRRRSLNRRLILGGNCGITQIKGSPDPLYFLGAKLLGFTSVTPFYSGCGLMFTASTYGDRLGLTFPLIAP